MSRWARIALREYLAYVRTPGFWLSILLLPLGISLYAAAPALLERSTPARMLAVVDFTGRDLTAPIARALGPERPGAPPLARVVPAPGAPFASPQEAVRRLKPWLAGERRLPGGARLDAFAVLSAKGQGADIAFWSRDVGGRVLPAAVRVAVAEALRRQSLASAGVDPTLLQRVDSLQPTLIEFSPKSATGRVRLKDRLPGFAGFGMGMLLWMVVFTGAGMLLNSVIEEKSSRILEVLLTSASATEIMAGKIAGVAGVTATVLGFWTTLAATVLAIRFPGVAADLAQIFITRWLWAYFLLFFVGGYLMFATFYVTVGAFCETTREAQTLLGPMMILMSVPIIFMGQAISRPDAPLLQALSWVPPFTPFMMAARAGSGPPLWQVLGSGAMILAVTGLELWIAIPAFRSGALTSGRFELRRFLAGLAGRGE